MQTAFVEHFRIERAYRRVQPPCLRQEQSAVGRDRRVDAEDVVEGRNIDAVGMASLDRLFELPWISKKNDALGGLGNGQDVGERHLSGLVDEENVYAVVGV